jgi:type I restriction enzyme, R subunit
MPLLELITKIGIEQAIANLPNSIKANQTAVAETIENNVRSKILKESLSDPAYYAKMSALLDEIIAARKQKAIEYEEYLKKMAALARNAEQGQDEGLPAKLKTPGQRALYNNLLKKTSLPQGQASDTSGTYSTTKEADILELALKIDQTVKHIRPDDWRGNQSKEQQIKAALYGILQDVDEVERIFLIIQGQSEY